MNYLNKNTPEGTRDLLYSEAELYDDLTKIVQQKLRNVRIPQSRDAGH